MKAVMRFVLIALWILCLRPGYAAPITLTLLPGPAVSGPAGSTVGWGYRITNNNADWVETVNLTSDLFHDGTPNSIFDFPVIAPFATVTLAFSQTASGACPTPDCGLFEFTWDGDAAAGTMNTGTFTISSELFGSNPLTDPNAIDLGPGSDATATYSAAVNGTPIPEPSPFLMLFSGLAAYVGWKRQSS